MFVNHKKTLFCQLEAKPVLGSCSTCFFPFQGTNYIMFPSHSYLRPNRSIIDILVNLRQLYEKCMEQP